MLSVLGALRATERAMLRRMAPTFRAAPHSQAPRRETTSGSRAKSRGRLRLHFDFTSAILWKRKGIKHASEHRGLFPERVYHVLEHFRGSDESAVRARALPLRRTPRNIRRA